MANATTKHASKFKDPNFRALVGKRVRYIGAGRDVVVHCTRCNKSTHRGMVSEYQGKVYCSENCVLASV